MDRPESASELRGSDPGRLGTTLANAFELIAVAFEVAGVHSVIEIGAYEGALTEELLEWTRAHGEGRGRVVAIDPDPADGLVALAERHDDLELVRERSHDALRHAEILDAVIVDGDHNYYTVSGELRLIAERSEGPLPLVVLHDMLWPHGRRDLYFEPGDIPPEHRHPTANGGGLVPGDPGTAGGGIDYGVSAAREGGPRNGVRSAVEDFMAEHEGLRLAIAPMFFGVGILWSESAPWSAAMAEAMRPWDRNPMLERLEANRVWHLAHNVRSDQVLRALRDSGAFSIIDWLSAVRHLGRGFGWRKRVDEALGEGGPDAAPGER
jgi:hypothetical protein